MSQYVDVVSSALTNYYNQFMGFSIPKRVGLVAGTGAAYLLTRYVAFQIRERSKPFNKYTTNEEAINRLNLTGNIAIVTGSNNGIGKETARVLAKQGCNVIMACRSIDKANAAKQEILESLNLEGSTNDANDQLQVMALDLSSLASVKEFADQINGKNLKINYLINNAGIMALPDYRESKDGYEMQFATNHLGHFYLTMLLMPSLLKKVNDEAQAQQQQDARLPRVINLSSSAHRRPVARKYQWTLDLFNDCISSKTFMGNFKKYYNAWVNYGISKTSNIFFTRELQKRYNGELISVAVHPGGVSTGLAKHVSLADGLWFLVVLFTNPTMLWTQFKPIECGASTSLRCVSLTDDEIVKGAYYANTDVAEVFYNSVARKDKDEGVLAAKLWELSETLITAKGFSLTP